MSNVYKDLYELQKQNKALKETIKDCLGHIYCIGGPLNDNIKGYTKDQLNDFFTIAQLLKSV